MSGQKTINVLFIASEAAPLVKVGGLGDVSGSLPLALRKLSSSKNYGKKLDVRLVIPFHSIITRSFENIQLIASFSVPHPSGNIPARAFLTYINDLPIYLIEGSSILTDESVYSSDTIADGKKYIFFSLAVLELVKKINWHVDILHGNDWHTAISVYNLKNGYSQDLFFKNTKSVLTLHNLPFMGGGTKDIINEFGIRPCDCPELPEWARFFPLPLGMYAADHILTVSPNYAKEILTPEYGCGLQEFLTNRKKSVSGILNGLDNEYWDPANDKAIQYNFDIPHLLNRNKNKTVIQNEFGLALKDDVPLFILISRMDQQKGIDIAVKGMRMVSNLPWQAIFLGTGNPEIESECRSLETEFPDRVRAAIRFDLDLSRRMYAGGDFILIPSRYEPCGLTQMIGMRYGCIPIARSTGGLKDSIQDNHIDEENNGFLFDEAKPEAFAKSINRAIDLFSSKDQLIKMQINGMESNFSWDKSALEYANIYRQLLDNPSQ